MILHVTDAKYLNRYTIWVRFNNGVEGTIDLSNDLNGEIFEPLKNLEQFKKFKVDSILETIVWENGADLAPEFIYDKLKKAA